MARKMFEKAGLIPGLQAGPKPAGDSAPAAESPKAKTAPGTMMGFLTAQSWRGCRRAEALKARVKSLEEEAPLQKLDPSIIRPSKWANRPRSVVFFTADFQDLKAEIAAAGGNVQPIKVRPVPMLNGFNSHSWTDFRADLRTPQASRLRLNWAFRFLPPLKRRRTSACSNRWSERTADAKTCLPGSRGRCTAGRLMTGCTARCADWLKAWASTFRWCPKASHWRGCLKTWLQRFQSPLDIQFRWAAPLTEAMQKDPDGTLARARAIAAARGDLGAAAILSKLIGLPESTTDRPEVSGFDDFQGREGRCKN